MSGNGSPGEDRLHKLKKDRLSKMHLSGIGFRPFSASIDRREGVTGASRKSVREDAGLSRKRGVVWVFIAILIGSSLGFAFVISPAMQKTHVEYTPHPVILIDGDAELADLATDEGWPGDGTEFNPYVFTGYEVSALGSDEGIYVGNTTSHLLISSCYVHDASVACIMLFNVTNVSVSLTVCESSQQGIDIVSSALVEVAGNSCTMAYDGIRVTGSELCALEANNCSGNLVGLMVQDSANVTIELNNMSYNVVSGMHLNRTISSSMANNTCSWNQYGTYMSECSLVFLETSDWDGNSGSGLWMHHCYDVTAERNRARNSHDGPGMSVDDSGRCHLGGNSVEGCGEGIRCSGSDDCDIRDSHCSGNRGNGIAASGSGRCSLVDNECSDNGGHGLSAGMCDDGFIERNRCTRNVGHGISCSDCQRCDIYDNTCTGNEGTGLSCLRFVSGNITGNILNSSAGNGMGLELSSDVNVSDNVCADLHTGIRFESSDAVTVYNNTVSDCTLGIAMSWCIGIVLRENVMVNDGVYIDGPTPEYWNSHEIGPTNSVNGLPVLYLVLAVSLEVTGTPGQIILVTCYDVKIEGLDLSNASVGVLIAYSDTISIRDCTCSDGYIGISGTGSYSMTIQNTICNRNSYSGVDLEYCEFCTVSEGTFEDNVEHGVRLMSTNICYVTSCFLSGSQVGILTSSSSSAGTMGLNHISNCTAGVMVSSANNPQVILNLIEDCDCGVWLQSSAYLTLTGNTFTGCGLQIDSDFLNGWNTHTIDTNNEVNGMELVYLVGISGLTLPSGAGQVVLADCSMISIVSMDLSDCTVGVLAGFSDHISVVNCVMSGNQAGVKLSHVDDSEITENTISDCDIDGVRLVASNRNIVEDNTITGSGTGVGLYEGVTFSCTANQITFNDAIGNEYGVVVDDCYGNAIQNNTLDSNLACGVLVNSSDSTAVRNNSCTGNGDMAISISGSDLCAVANNTCSVNGRGICLCGSGDCAVTGNTLYGNSECGVCLDAACAGNSIWYNVFAYNNGSDESYDPLHVQACDDGENLWNASGEPVGRGNYWHDWTVPDDDLDGIVDVPYDIAGSAGARDYFPVAEASGPIEPIPEFSMLFVVVAVALMLLGLARRRRG